MVSKKLLVYGYLAILLLGNVFAQNGESFQSTHKIFVEDGAWYWFSDPRAVSFTGQYKRTYVGFVTSTGDITISSYDHKSGEITSKVIYPEFQRDDHINPSLLFLPDGRLMAFFTRHNGGFYYFTTLEPEDISQ